MFLYFLSLKLGPRLKILDVTHELRRGKKWEDESFTAHTTPMHLKLPHTMKEGDIYIYIYMIYVQSINLCQTIKNISLWTLGWESAMRCFFESYFVEGKNSW